jgi:putative heme iron utilization protein
MNDTTAAFMAARRDAKRLLRTARTGALATMDEGRPLTTLIGVASDWDGAPLFLMSELSRHTHNLAVDARASLLLTTEGGRGDPLNQPRITLNGIVRKREGDDGRERYARRNPKAKLYIGFADFSLRRLEIETVHFNGGFGRADKLTTADILTAGEVSELAQVEAYLLDRVEALGDEAIAKLAGGGTARPFKPVGIDADGLDLSRGGEAARVDFNAPAFDGEGWWAALRRLLG